MNFVPNRNKCLCIEDLSKSQLSKFNMNIDDSLLEQSLSITRYLRYICVMCKGIICRHFLSKVHDVFLFEVKRFFSLLPLLMLE